MYAIFINNGCAYKQIDYEGEQDTFELDYILVDTLPDELVNIPEGYRCRYDTETETFYHEEIPQPPKTEEQTKIEQLEAENMELKLALAELAETSANDKLEMQLAIAELAETIAGGE